MSLPIAKAFKECGAQTLRLQYQKFRYAISSAIHICLKYNNYHSAQLVWHSQTHELDCAWCCLSAQSPLNGEIHCYIIHSNTVSSKTAAKHL